MKGACVWCSKLVKLPEGFDHKKTEIVCSPACKTNEINFRVYFSDANIGERNLKDHGINPNERGKNA